MKHLTSKKIKYILVAFKFPAIVLFAIVSSLIFQYLLHFDEISKFILIGVIVAGSTPFFIKNIYALFQKKFALDYIAVLAIIVGLLSGQYLVTAIIVLMLSGGTALEEYGTSQAKESLTALTDRIPNEVLLWRNDSIAEKVVNDDVKIGDEIFVRKGEVIPLDGILVSDVGLTDESSLTGEPYMMDKIKGDQIRSGTVNIGNGIIIKVTKENKNSTYRKIIEMVKKAQSEKAPLIRLADRYSIIFTILTIILSTLAYFISHDFTRVLAVLVIATPCPLILATPIALMGGMNASAKLRIIMKKLSSIEVLSRVDTIIFDKTGTITLGKPFVKHLDILDSSYTREQIYSISEAIERNSLHPLAKAIVNAVRKEKHQIMHAKNVKEQIGSGILGEVNGAVYSLSKVKDFKGMAIQLVKGNKRIGLFEFEDKIKENSKEVIAHLKKLGLDIFIFTGDKKEVANKVAKKLGGLVTVRAEYTPENKSRDIQKLKHNGKITAMVGDGINDAPALATADVGIVFSNEEQTASSEAADVVLLGGDFSSVIQVIDISKRTIRIALESILFGIGLSTVGMIFAATGYIIPIIGALIQELIDLIVILNALRTTKLR